MRQTAVNFRAEAEASKISGESGNFTITCSNGSKIGANHVVLAIGTQGNPRRLGVEGDSSQFVQYQLDDPDEYKNEDILLSVPAAAP